MYRKPCCCFVLRLSIRSLLSISKLSAKLSASVHRSPYFLSVNFTPSRQRRLRVRLSSLLILVGRGGGGALPGRDMGKWMGAPARMASPASRMTAMN